MGGSTRHETIRGSPGGSLVQNLSNNCHITPSESNIIPKIQKLFSYCCWKKSAEPGMYKPCKSWWKLPTSTGAEFLNHEQYHDVLSSHISPRANSTNLHGIWFFCDSSSVLMFRSHSQAIFSPSTLASFLRRFSRFWKHPTRPYIPGNWCIYMWYIRVGISCQQRVMMLLPTTRDQNQKLTICVTVAISKKKGWEQKRVSVYRRKILPHLKKSTCGNKSLYHDCYVWSELSSTRHIQRTLKEAQSKYIQILSSYYNQMPHN